VTSTDPVATAIKVVFPEKTFYVNGVKTRIPEHVVPLFTHPRMGTQAHTGAVLHEILRERDAQDRRWGQQNHPDVRPGTSGREYRSWYENEAWQYKTANDERVQSGHVAWDYILLEEVFEALAEEDPARLREELIQVAAVACAWVEAIDRRGVASQGPLEAA
jgi:hypothetical protein